MTDCGESVKEQLFKALQADEKKEKDYHLRQTLQIFNVENVPEEVDPNPEIRKVE